jgi:hypothetical protein
MYKTHESQCDIVDGPCQWFDLEICLTSRLDGEYRAVVEDLMEAVEAEIYGDDDGVARLGKLS